MKLGFGLPVSGAWATASNLSTIAVESEALGYDSVWAFQRLLHPLDEEWGPAYHSVLDPLSVLAFVAASTSRVRLGLAVVNIPFYPPLVLSKSLTTLDVLSAGRLDIGLGLGWSAEEFAAVGVPLAARGRRAEEFLAYLRATWTDDEPQFDGEFYALPRSSVEPKPVQRPHPPLLMGATADGALQRIGRLADGWISSSRTDLVTIDRSIDVVRAAAAAAGRDPGSLRFVVRGVVGLTDLPLDQRVPLHGSVEQIRDDLAALGQHGVTEVFIDSNWDPQTVSEEVGGEAGMAHARSVMRALAPSPHS